ncbi:MAG: bifunctional diguanylate cyclase/phosphodiesterase [Shewanella sp.]
MDTRHFQLVLESVVNSRAKAQGDFLAMAELVADTLSETLAVDCLTIWQFDHLQSVQQPICQRFLNETPLFASASIRPHDLETIPAYLDYLLQHCFINASATNVDERVSEIYSQCLAPRAITSTLDVAIRINGHIEGVICLESQVPDVCWQPEEINFVSQLADQLALTLATQQSYQQQDLLTQFRSALAQSDQITLLVDLENLTISYANRAYLDFPGLSSTVIDGKSLTQTVSFKQHPTIINKIIEDLRQGKHAEGELALTLGAEKCFYFAYHASPFISEQGKSVALITAKDNTHDIFIRSELERLAWRCSLTNLYNRSHFNLALEHCQQGYLILIDLIGFKRFNDTYGHEQGDDLLIETARRLTSFADNYGAKLIARVGSDEFAIVIDDNNAIDIESVAASLLSHLSQVIIIGYEQVTPKPALAVVNLAYKMHNMSPMACVDIAVQHAKKKVGLAIQFFSQRLLEDFQQAADTERDLRIAICNHQFELYYQPLMDLQQQAYIGAEALLRWHHPTKGTVSPNCFIAIAEQTGLIVEIGAWILASACKQLYLWQQQGLDLCMHVNVSARQFFSGNLFEQVWHFMTRYQLQPQRLILEITETELMEDIKYATKLCEELTDIGVGLAIDDFGTGYCSMRYLKQFPISKLKIDQSFIADITSSHESREIVSAIIAMAKALNISLTAEGVETLAQEKFLMDNGCDQAQGYLYSPALRQKDFMQFIVQHQQAYAVNA